MGRNAYAKTLALYVSESAMVVAFTHASMTAHGAVAVLRGVAHIDSKLGV